jgi:hypothetical protein
MSRLGTGFSLPASNGETAEVRCRESVGFNGPIMVEGVRADATAEATTANAGTNRECLENALNSRMRPNKWW